MRGALNASAGLAPGPFFAGSDRGAMAVGFSASTSALRRSEALAGFAKVAQRACGVPKGAAVALTVDLAAAYFFDADTGEALPRSAAEAQPAHAGQAAAA